MASALTLERGGGEQQRGERLAELARERGRGARSRREHHPRVQNVALHEAEVHEYLPGNVTWLKINGNGRLNSKKYFYVYS